MERLAEKPFKSDTTPANGSSIAFIAEYEGNRCLFASDAHPHVLETSLQQLLTTNGQPRLHLDAFKVPHHGSSRNLSVSLLEHIDCRHYLVSSSGNYLQTSILDFMSAAALDERADPRVRDLARRLVDAFERARQRAYGDEAEETEGRLRSSDSPHSAPPTGWGRTREAQAEARDKQVEARWLQAQVFDDSGRRCEHALRASARHRLVVRIRPPEKDWIIAPGGAPVPEGELPDDEEEYELRVIFWEPWSSTAVHS